MELDENKDDSQKIIIYDEPIIDDINWNDNGKITFSFRYCPRFTTYTITKFKLYYCYFHNDGNVSDDNNWYRHASNNWRIIVIPTTNNINKNIELRIATNKDIYDDDKNENIELLLKIRCELKGKKWQIHTFYSEFSKIYFVKSNTIPLILSKNTKIRETLNGIFNLKDADSNKKIMAKQQLSSLYETYENDHGITKVFTKLLNKEIEKYYKTEYEELIGVYSNNDLPKYLLKVEENIEWEKQNLFPFIKKHLNDDQLENIVSTMVNIAFHNGLTKQLLTSNSINRLFIESVDKWPFFVDGFNQLITFYNYLQDTMKLQIDNYFCDAIKYLFKTNTQNQNNISLLKVHDNINSIINDKLKKNQVYIDSMRQGMKWYINNLNQHNYFQLILQNALKNDVNAKQGML